MTRIGAVVRRTTLLCAIVIAYLSCFALAASDFDPGYEAGSQSGERDACLSLKEDFFTSNVMRGVAVETDGRGLGVDSSEGSVLYRGNSNDLSGLDVTPFSKRITTGMWGEWSRYTGSDQGLRSGFSANHFGGTVGMDRLLGDRVLLGFGAIGSGMKITGADPQYGAQVDTFAGKLHLSVFDKLWYLDFGVGAGKSWNEQWYASGQTDWRERYSVSQWNYDVDFGLRIRKGYTRIDPFIGFHLTTLNEPGEANLFPGEPVPAFLNDTTTNSYRMFVGSRLSWEYKTYLALICPKMLVGWQHEFGETDVFITNEILPFPVAWHFDGTDLSRDRLYLGAGITCALKHSVDLFFYYNSIFSGTCNDNTIYGGLYKKY
ncbi:MAG: autotransporter outer membrane beta-barrel domain-containing protein [Planctomycetia bacterium]|nr:autotransporter outer membrane beta-barrel domain-containing protein [Planctomycetia bacterium]